jgi:hypothetical protein
MAGGRVRNPSVGQPEIPDASDLFFPWESVDQGSSSKRSRVVSAHWRIAVSARSTVGVPMTNGLGSAWPAWIEASFCNESSNPE